MLSRFPSLFKVCGLLELNGLQAWGPSRVLSIIDPELAWPDDLAFPPPCQHVTMRFHDEIEPIDGKRLPERADVEQIVAIGRQMAASGPQDRLLVHCHAGISRSTAALAIVCVSMSPDAEDPDVLDAILAMRPQAWPNSTMIRLADDILGRRGRLVSATIGLFGKRLRADPALADLMHRVRRSRDVADATASGA